MAENSKIQWTDHTFNPWIGCMKISPGCKECYAETLMTRKTKWANTWGPAESTERIRTTEQYWQQPLKWAKQAFLDQVRPKVFCASLADVFEDNDALIEWRLELFIVIRATPQLDWLILTKRPDVARHFFRLRPDLLYPNIWLGTSIEDQQRADERIPELLKIPAPIRFLSVEPMLDEINLRPYILEKAGPAWAGSNPSPGIDWVIVGGESGPRARPFDVTWAFDLLNQCAQARIPVFMKQLGDNPQWNGVPFGTKAKKGGDPGEWPASLQIRQFPERMVA